MGGLDSKFCLARYCKVHNAYWIVFIYFIFYEDTLVQVVCGLVWLKNVVQKDMCLKEIALLAQNSSTIPGSIINIIGEGGGGSRSTT